MLARYQSQRLVAFIETTLEQRFGLEINRDKTRIVDLKEPKASLEFLGYSFRFDRSLQGRDGRYLNMQPSKKSLTRVKAKLREMTGPCHCFQPIPEWIGQINRMLTGWAQYFRQGYPAKAYRQVNWYTRDRLTTHLRRRSQRPYQPPKDVTYYEQLTRLGLIYLTPRRIL